ncbi:telomere repeats-binding bouquet formation protein 1-like [Rhinoraja longicauda]
MDNPEGTNSTILCGLKTDLDLLLECLKYQMDSPETQKQALVTIYSICQQNCEASEYFRMIGGLEYIHGLIKLTDASLVHEAALFTLGALAESSVYCQQSLCTVELLSDLATSLAKKDASLILKRMDVYMILVLVSHNKIGQALARTTGCIDVLLNLFSLPPAAGRHQAGTKELRAVINKYDTLYPDAFRIIDRDFNQATLQMSAELP